MLGFRAFSTKIGTWYGVFCGVILGERRTESIYLCF